MNSMKKNLTDFAVINLGMLLASMAVHFFMQPAHLVIGSVAGLALLLQKILPLPLSAITFLLNLILLAVGWFLVGKDFGAKTIYTSLILSPFLFLFEMIAPVNESLTGDPMLDLLGFTLLLALSQTLLFRHNASSGGLDIIAKILNKYLRWELSTSIILVGGLIAFSSLFVFDVRTMILGVIGTWLNGVVLDYFMIGFANRKRVCIITDRWEEVRRFVIEDLHRGATMYPIIGGYREEHKIEIETIVTRREFHAIQNYLLKEDIRCFMTASNVHEIYGTWFDNERHLI